MSSTFRTAGAFGTSRFIVIIENTYATSDLPSVLRLLETFTLIVPACDEGMIVEQHPADNDEVRTMDEAAACGTAVVITAVTSLAHKNETIEIRSRPGKVG